MIVVEYLESFTASIQPFIGVKNECYGKFFIDLLQFEYWSS